jgi:hypothetical protein
VNVRATSSSGNGGAQRPFELLVALGYGAFDAAILPGVLLEIAQIWRRLVLFGGHQEAVGAKEINFLADANMSVAFGADLVAKPDRFLARDAPVGLGHHPRSAQRMVDGGDIIVK